MTRAFLLSGLAALSLAACQSAAEPDRVSRQQVSPAAAGTPGAAPPGADPGTCWTRQTLPAVIETVTRHRLVEAAKTAPDGRVLTPARYRTERRQHIVEERRAIRFQTPCPNQVDREFIASLQRALATRGLYRGEVSGRYDTATRLSVRSYQAEMGLESGVLSLKAARTLGLVPYPRPQAEN